MKLCVLVKEIDGVPSEFQLLPYGEISIHTRKRPAVLDEAAMKTVIAKFDARGNDMVIDYEHQTEMGTQAPAAGWIKQLVNRGRDGLWAIVEWTDKAKEYLKNREYRYFSPVMWIHEVSDRVALLEHVALTNDPAINNLKPIMAKMKLAKAGTRHDHNEEEVNMDKIREMLELPAETPADKIEGRVALVISKCADLETKLADAVTQAADAARVVACKEVMTALGTNEGATADDLVKIITGMKALETPAQKLALKVQELETRIASRESDDIVQEALKSGRTSPAELEEWGNDLAKTSPDQFRKIVLSRTAGSVIPLDKLRVAKGKPEGLADEAQKGINKQLGISDETYTKFGPKKAD